MKKETKYVGIGLLDVVFVVLLILKLTHQIDISWWLVTAPLWGPFAFVITSPLIILAFLLLGILFLPVIVLVMLLIAFLISLFN